MLIIKIENLEALSVGIEILEGLPIRIGTKEILHLGTKTLLIKISYLVVP